MLSKDKTLIRVLSGESLQPPPIWLMRQAGRYLPEYRQTRKQAGSFLDLCYNPELAVEVTLQPIRRYGFDASILFSDILVVPHALGQKLWFVEGQGPKLTALENAAAVAQLDRSGFHDRLAPVYETVRGLSQALPAETALIGFSGAPWTVASYMIEGGSSRDFATAKLWAYKDPSGFSQLIDLLVEMTAEYLCRQIEAGAEVLQIFDSWAGAWPADQVIKWSLQPILAIVRAVKAKHPHVPVIVFPKGVGPNYIAFAAIEEFDGLSLDSSLPLGWVKDNLAGKITLQGNLDPLLLVSGGDALAAAVDKILEIFAGTPFIFNLGHGIVPQTPPEHVAELVARVRGQVSKAG